MSRRVAASSEDNRSKKDNQKAPIASDASEQNTGSCGVPYLGALPNSACGLRIIGQTPAHQSLLAAVNKALAAMPKDVLAHVPRRTRSNIHGGEGFFSAPRPSWALPEGSMEERSRAQLEYLRGPCKDVAAKLWQWIGESCREVLECLSKTPDVANAIAGSLPKPWTYESMPPKSSTAEALAHERDCEKWRQDFLCHRPLLWLWGLWQFWEDLTHTGTLGIGAPPPWPGLDAMPKHESDIFLGDIRLGIGPGVSSFPGESAHAFKEALEQLRDKLSEPGAEKGQTKARGGRNPLSQIQQKRYMDILREWKSSRHAKSRKEFCEDWNEMNDDSITVATLEKAQNWKRERDRHNKP